LPDSVYPAAPDSEYGREKLFSYLDYRRNYGMQTYIARYHNTLPLIERILARSQRREQDQTLTVNQNGNESDKTLRKSLTTLGRHGFLDDVLS
jgi:hypothetical protein